MRQTIKNTLAYLANTNLAWPLFRLVRTTERRLAYFSDYVERQRATGTKTDLKSKLISEFFEDLTVKHGPFTGLRYPSASATGSALLPKLLGTYEDEIAPFIQTISKRSYTHIVDIGCAEGYYAVGLARLFPTADIHAYDVDLNARQLCRAMADTNEVADRLVLGGWCDAQRLAALPENSRALIFADCEGYEAKLFTAESVGSLIRHDLIIECHDFMDPTISERLRAVFAATHTIEEVDMEPDFYKALRRDLPELQGLDRPVRHFMVSEARGLAQSWMFLSAKAAKM